MTGGESEENTQVPLSSRPPTEPSAGLPAEPVRASPAGPTRRTFLLGGGLAVVAGAGAGVGVEYWQDRPKPVPARHAPAALRAALAAEQDLIASLDAALPTAGTAAVFLRQARADHVAHQRALAAAVTEAGGAPPAPTGTASPPSAPAKSVAQLRQSEADASRRAAKRAAVLGGRDATLLASIAACEASHAELLS